MSDRYYVVQAQPQRERLAVHELHNQGFQTFFPLIARAPRARRGVYEIPPPLPLFPRYLFVLLDLQQDPWRSINGTRGVTRLMCMDDERPSPVPIPAMDRILAAGELLHPESAALPFNTNDTVEFTEGPMQGLRAVVQLCEADRVTLLLDMLGGKRTVRCEPRSLRYVST